MRIGSLLFQLSVISFVGFGCSGSEGSNSNKVGDDCDAGSEGCACDEESNCDDGLVCLSDVCVEEFDGPTPSGGDSGIGDGDSGGSSDSGGTDAGGSPGAGGRETGGASSGG